MSDHNDLIICKPEPHPLKAQLRRYGVNISDLAFTLHVSNAHMYRILSGYSKARPEIEEKLRDIALQFEALEEGGGD